jgi:hypothetical protein
MTKKEILEKLEKLSPEQREFIFKEINKHSQREKKNSQEKETLEQKQKNKI